jgi:hypothetical protein
MIDHPVAILSFVILLPLLPAFLLFKLLPARAVVKGPLSGLQVNLSGAFGGYVALTVFITGVAAANHMLKPADPVWHVRGAIQLEQDDIPPGTHLQFELMPLEKTYKAAIDKTFDVDIPMADRAPIPHFFFNPQGYVGERVELSDLGRPGNYKSHMENATTLVIEEPIVLRKAAPPSNTNAKANIAGAGG